MNAQDFRKRNFGLLGMLVLQFILGMALNLFVKLPDTHPGTSGSNYFARIAESYGWGIAAAGGITLMVHIIVATGLLAGSIVLMVQAIRSKRRPWITTAAVGAIAIIGAMFNGLSFVSYNQDLSSFIMAMGYIIATIAYVAGVVLNHNPAAPTRTQA
jgi:hypothetical protein